MLIYDVFFTGEVINGQIMVSALIDVWAIIMSLWLLQMIKGAETKKR